MSCIKEIIALSGFHVITFGILANYQITIKEKCIKLEKENKKEKKELQELKEKFCDLEKKLEKQEKEINFQTR